MWLGLGYTTAVFLFIYISLADCVRINVDHETNATVQSIFFHLTIARKLYLRNYNYSWINNTRGDDLHNDNRKRRYSIVFAISRFKQSITQ